MAVRNITTFVDPGRSYTAIPIVDAIYAMILLLFTVWSHVPMSTTWVFIGLLAGREIGIRVTQAKTER